MVKAILRTKSIGTKVTEEEYARLDELAAAAGRSRAEWVRDILIGQLQPRAAKAQEETVLAELLGLRAILLKPAVQGGQGRADDRGADAIADRGGRRRQDRAGAEAAGAGMRRQGAVMSQWGRKIYQSWPSRHPVWTIAAFFGAAMFFLMALAMQFQRNWSFVERFYLPVYAKTWMHGLFPKAQTRYSLINGVTAKG